VTRHATGKQVFALLIPTSTDYVDAELRSAGVRVGRDPSIISWEVRRHGGRGGYRAVTADTAAGIGRERPKLFAVERSLRLRAVVGGLLRQGWSPASIAGRLPYDYPLDQACRVLTKRSTSGCTPSRCPPLPGTDPVADRRPARRSGPRPVAAPRIREPRYLDERPAEVEGRQVPGHWEGDLVIGKAGKTAVATLVERSSRFLILVPLSGRDSLSVGDAVIAATHGLPAQIRRSLTWDCGAEMARHASITATGLPVFFAHPHSPWECGSNENLNRIVREFFPKDVPVSSDPAYLAMVASDINNRPP
jgi:IS30 family transposase